ncbi:hypothetical protein STANM309S_01870 [Streptomyces tanashiensis]
MSGACFQVPTYAAGTTSVPALTRRKVLLATPEPHSTTSVERSVRVWRAAGVQRWAGTLAVISASPRTSSPSVAEIRVARPMHSRSPVTWV